MSESPLQPESRTAPRRRSMKLGALVMTVAAPLAALSGDSGAITANHRPATIERSATTEAQRTELTTEINNIKQRYPDLATSILAYESWMAGRVTQTNDNLATSLQVAGNSVDDTVVQNDTTIRDYKALFDKSQLPLVKEAGVNFLNCQIAYLAEGVIASDELQKTNPVIQHLRDEYKDDAQLVAVAEHGDDNGEFTAFCNQRADTLNELGSLIQSAEPAVATALKTGEQPLPIDIPLGD